MTSPGADFTGDQWREWMSPRVGGFFRNTLRSPSLTCTYCTGPSITSPCDVCRNHRTEFGNRLADDVITLTYAQDQHPDGVHQSRTTAYAYKRNPPAPKARADMSLTVYAATRIHGPCIASLDSWWDAVTFVPSTRREGPVRDHPAAELARQVQWVNEPQNRLVLEPGPDVQGPARVVLPEKFLVSATYAPRVEGRHVLLVDDTWTSGANVQSAAIALKVAGARRVTALCVTRWTRWDWAEHRTVLEAIKDTPYDPVVCPVHGGRCEMVPLGEGGRAPA